MFIRNAAGLAAGAGACVVLACLSGCYQRTVAARGIGAASHEISEPYQESGPIDEWFFGPLSDDRKLTPMNRNSSRLDR